MPSSRRPGFPSELRFKLPQSSRSAPSSSSSRADLGPRERWQHATRVLEPDLSASGGVRARAMEESVLDALALRHAISPLQRLAALRLRADFLDAGMGAHLAASYNPAHVGFSVNGVFQDRSDKQEVAYRRWRTAIKCVGGALADVVVSCACCEETPAPEHEAFLKVGLAKLVLHYGLSGSDENVDEASAWQMGLGGGDGAIGRRVLH